jgi:hypothetical protein
MPRRVPELFLGLLAISVAVIWTAKIAAGAIHDARHVHDTITITGSAREPISSDLVQWSLTVYGTSATEARAAKLLHADSLAVVAFLRGAGVPAAAITPAVVTSEEIVTPLPHKRRRITYRVAQELDLSTRKIDLVEAASRQLGRLLERGIDVAAQPLAYISTELTQAKLAALKAATEDARQRAEILVQGLGGRIGAMRSSSLGVYQITPRNSTDVSDYGINDTSSRLKDVTAVVSATFAVSR